MPEPGLATAADYSEALLTARRAKSTLSLLIALMLVGQIAVFLLLRYDVVKLPAAVDVASTQPASSQRLIDVMHYLTGVMVLAGLALPIVLAMTLCLIGHVMLVGRLIGVGRVTSALIWTFVLLLLLVPWQFFMNNAGLTITDFRVPGVLWTWDELVARYKFDGTLSADRWHEAVLSWFRFVGAPVVALFFVLLIQMKSNRGLRMALGEDELLNEMLRQQ